MKSPVWPVLLCSALIAVSVGCVDLFGAGERNAFLTLTETFGVARSDDTDDGGAGTAILAAGEFRRLMTVTLANNNPNAELNTMFVAWVSPNSIRSAEQQDALLNSGYVQLTRQVDLGSVFSLPPGTFVFGGPGVAGASTLFLTAALGDGNVVPVTREFSLLTPDVILVFSQPPVACDTVAFFYSLDGDPLTAVPVAGPESPFSGATGVNAFKTLAQVDVYQCEPFKPGLFLKLGGGARLPNEFFEGENVRFDYFGLPDANGDFANVTIE